MTLPEVLTRIRGWAVATLAATTGIVSPSAQAQASTPAPELRIGYFSLERVLRDSAPARAAEQRLKTEFARRDRELTELNSALKSAVERYDKEQAVLSETERLRRQRELQDMDREYQRKFREYREDLNQRRNDETQVLIDRAQRVVRQIAEQERLDLVVQEVLYFNPRIDITDRVLKVLNNGK